MHKRVVGLFFFSFLRALVYCQQVSTQVLTVDNGLPTNAIFSIYEDHFGYLWIGTSNGLSRFDGRQFVNYGIADGLPSIYVDNVFEDSQYRLWVATRRGMAQLSGDRFISHPLDDRMNIMFTYGFIQTKKGKIWAISDMGVYQFEDSLWKKIPLHPTYRNTRQVVETDSGLYVNYGQLLAFLDRSGKWKVIEEHPLQEIYFNRMIKCNGKILVNTKNKLFELQNNKLVLLADKIEGVGHFSYLIDAHNRLWYCHAYNDSSIHLSEAGNYTSNTPVLANHYDIIPNLVEDSHGNIWAATSQGLLKINTAPLELIENGSNSSKNICGVLPLPDTSVLLFRPQSAWIGKYDNHLHHWNISFFQKTNIGLIDCYTGDHQGGLWISTRSRDLFHFSEKKFINLSSLIPYSYTSFISAAFDEKRQRIFLCDDSAVWTGNERHVSRFVQPKTSVNLTTRSYVLATKTGHVILYVPESGIYEVNDDDNFVRLYQTHGNNDYHFYGKLHEDKEQNIWFANETTGLLRFRFDTHNQFRLFDTVSKRDGLSDNLIYSIASDAMNRLWVLTPSGIDILQKNASSKWEVYNFTKDLGLKFEWSVAKLTEDARGDVWLNDLMKTVRFNCNDIVLKREIPQIAIEKILVNSKEPDWGSYGDSLITYRQFPVNPKLDFPQNTINIHFNGISFSSFQRLEYSYWLSPLDTAWSQPANSNSVTFVNMRPDQYEFKVRVRDGASGWSEPAIFSFTIKAPFWMKWWFITLAGVVISMFIFGLYKYRINRLKELLAIRTKISQDLHDEVGSTLTSINILSRVSKSNIEKDGDKAASLMQKITEQSQNIQQSMSDIVWSIRPDSDKMENLVTRMREYLGETVEVRGINVDFIVKDIDLKESLTMNQRRHFFLIFKEAVNNVVKYSEATVLNVTIERRKRQIKLTVNDNGKGFDTGKITSSNGLRNMESRAKQLGGTLSFHSVPGKGTNIELLCPTT